jgi:alpha-glucosidase (family GH31 glycosyl hydrolase)
MSKWVSATFKVQHQQHGGIYGALCTRFSHQVWESANKMPFILRRDAFVGMIANYE